MFAVTLAGPAARGRNGYAWDGRTLWLDATIETNRPSSRSDVRDHAALPRRTPYGQALHPQGDCKLSKRLGVFELLLKDV